MKKIIPGATFNLIIAILLAGCSLPLPVPDRNDSANRPLPYGELRTFDTVKMKFKDYHLLYAEEAQDKRKLAQSSSEIGFYSSILAVLGGIGKSPEVAIGGALLGAGSAMYSERYKLQVQATNLETASDAMLCMYLKSQDIPSDAILKNLTVDSKTADIATRDIAIDGFLQVRSKLYRLQSSFELGKPDPNKLKDALKAPPASVGNAAGFTVDDPTSKEMLTKYKSEIDQCVSKITG